MSLLNKKKTIIVTVIVSVILLAVILFLLWFFNRKFDVTFDLNNDTKEVTVQVKYNKTINEKDIMNKDDLGESFIDWYEVIKVQKDEYVLADKSFDFSSKITKNIKLKAVYTEKVETITITFDSKGGSKVDDITLNKGVELTLPKDPTQEGYNFKGWEDKNGTPIFDKALLNEDTILYAKWEKVVEKNTETANKTETKKEYYCESGYTLNGTKCIKTDTVTASVIKSCDRTYSERIGEKCVNISSTVERIATCANNGVYAADAGGCFYGEKGPAGVDKYTCENSMQGKYYNGHCYSELKQGSNADITYSCPDGYTLFQPSNNNSKCGKSRDITISYECSDGYTLNGTICTKTTTVDAKQR